MASPSVMRDAAAMRQASGVRPVTLLIASGIALILAILMITGIAARQLRERALSTASSELARIDSLLATATGRTLQAVDHRLGDVGVGIEAAADGGRISLRQAAAAADAGAALHRSLRGVPRLAAAALVAGDGEVIDRAGNWPVAAVGDRALVAALRAEPGRTSVLGAPIRDPRTGAFAIPLVRRIAGPAGSLAGAVVGLVPAADFIDLFAAVPLADTAEIALVGRDRAVLARYPARSAAAEEIPPVFFATAFGKGSAALGQVEENHSWRLVGLKAVAGYPVAITISRSSRRILAAWAEEGSWFVIFALVGSVAIAVMVYLIAHQIRTHDALAAMRAERIEAEKIEIERARLAAEAELLKSERLSVLGQLTATVAHELRNPLSAIRNTLFTVKELAADGGAKLDRPIARMERSIERCDRIISDLLEYTRTRELKRAPLSFDRWLSDLLAEQTMPPGIALVRELDADDATVPIDADRVRRVVINLVENAVQALAELPPERDRRVIVRSAIEDAALVLAIEDTGPGIPPENLGRIFEPLFSTKSFGTGLGLPTVKQIVNQHGGTISLDSEIGRGTCVTVRLPLAAEGTDGADAMAELKAAA
jgi:signal transduction histidine kinase